MFETFRLLNAFYRKEAQGKPYLHKIITYSHYFIFNFCALFISRDLVKHVFRNYIKFGFIPLRLNLKDNIIINHHIEDYVLFFEVLLNDEYKLKELKHNSIVVDVGANIGLVSLLASKRFRAKKIISYEPCANNFKFLKKNIDENNCHNVILNKCAVADKTGKIKLYLHGSATHSINKKKPGKHFEMVNMTTLDKSLKLEKNIDLLKVDVEGAELDVLKGATDTLKKTKQIIMEWTNLCSHEEIIAILKQNKFEVKIKKNLVYAHRKS